jgi:uncharacterized OB-fold protein
MTKDRWGRDKAQHLSYVKAWQESHRLRGLCLFCNNKALPGHSLCEKHLLSHNESNRKMKENYVLEGKCPKCGGPLLEDENRYCMVCQAEPRHAIPRKVMEYATAH